MPTHREDLALVALIVNGNECAAYEFSRRYVGRFERLARRAGIPPQDCQDVAQEALLAAISQMQRNLFRGDSSLGTWLEKIIQGKTAEYWRMRAKTAGDFSLQPAGDDYEAAYEDNHLELFQPAPNEHTVIAVRETLQLMHTHYRAVLLLKYGAGYTMEELSQTMDMTLSQVARWLYTAERAFRRIHNGNVAKDKSLMSAGLK